MPVLVMAKFTPMDELMGFFELLVNGKQIMMHPTNQAHWHEHANRYENAAIISMQALEAMGIEADVIITWKEQD